MFAGGESWTWLETHHPNEPAFRWAGLCATSVFYLLWEGWRMLGYFTVFTLKLQLFNAEKNPK